jgi:hypothetical protein
MVMLMLIGPPCFTPTPQVAASTRTSEALTKAPHGCTILKAMPCGKPWEEGRREGGREEGG